MCCIGTKKKNDEPSDMVRILSEMEKYASNINFDGWPFDHWKDQRERGTSYHKAKKISFLGLLKNKNELTLLNPYPSNNNKTLYISKPLVNCISTFLYLGSSQIINDPPK